MKAIVLIDGKIPEEYGKLRFEGVLPFTKEGISLHQSTVVGKLNAPAKDVVKVYPAFSKGKKKAKLGKKVVVVK